MPLERMPSRFLFNFCAGIGQNYFKYTLAIFREFVYNQVAMNPLKGE